MARLEACLSPIAAPRPPGQAGAPPEPVAQRVLVVDDDAGKRLALTAALGPLAVDVDQAAGATEALRLLLARSYAAILLDVRMPGMDGFELARLIRERPATATTPIIFVTAAEGVDELAGYGLGAIDFLGAPVNPAVLRAKVAVLLELARLVEREKALSDSKTAFLNLAAHELRTPLGVATGYLSLLLDGSLGTPPERWEEPLRVIAMKLAELQQLSDELIDTARVERHVVRPVTRALDLRDVARAAANRARPRARMLDGRVDLLVPVESVGAAADPRLIGRVLDNLVHNALSYGGAEPVVTVSVGPGPVIRVADQGKGVDESERERIFEEFHRRPPAVNANPRGTGLGLYLSRELARAMDGEVWLESTSATGSVFAVRMPAADLAFGARRKTARRRARRAYAI